MKYKKILKAFSIISVFMTTLFNFENNFVYAIKVEPYRLPGIEDVFWDTDVPYALKVTSAGDGLAVDTILYRTSYKDIDYYSPVLPDSLKGSVSDVNKGKYDDWGPWEMEANNTYRGVEVTYYYANGKLKNSATVYTDKGNGSSTEHQSVGTLPKDTSIEIFAIKGGYVYFDLTKYSSLSKKGATNVARVSESNVTYTSSKISLVFSGYSNSNLLTNFKPVGKYVDNMRSYYKGLSTGQYTNPNRSDVPSAVRGKSGEWRYIGYNAQGEALDSPYFLSDAPSFQNMAKFSGYPWRLTPWDPNDTRESGESGQSWAYQRFSIGGKTFNYDTQSKYKTLKQGVIDRLVKEGHISSASDYINRLSLRTYPTKQSTILLGQRKDDVYYRVGFMPLKEGLRDLYMKQIRVIDESQNNKVIANWTCGINGGCSYVSGNVDKGKQYRVEMVLANGADSSLIKNTLEAQVGYLRNESKVYTNLPYSSTRNGRILRIGSKGNMTNKIHSTSSPFINYIYVGDEKTIDIYGYVGGSHTGVDNLKYNNDMGVIRLNVNGNPPPPPSNGCTITNNGTKKICGGGDVVPHAIKIYSKTENGELVYRINYNETTPTVQKALIPGYEYRVVYVYQYKGTDIYEYEWSDGVQDNPATENKNEYVPPGWGEGKLITNRFTLNHYIEKYSGGIRDLDTISEGRTMYYSYGDFTDKSILDIPMHSNAMIELYADIIMYQHPYIKTNSKLACSNTRINSNQKNDSISATIKDNFDISVSNLRVSPSISYVGDNSKVSYNVTYDATLTTPSYVTVDVYEADFNTAIEINGENYYVKDHLLKGSEYNKNITHTIPNVKVPSSGNMSVSVNLNYARDAYETSNFANNVASTTVTLKKIKKPSDGSVSDTVKPSDSLNSNNPNKGGDANNNCLVPRTRNTWTSSHGKVSWSSTTFKYNKLSDRTQVTFNRYSNPYKNKEEAKVSYEEEFKITSILFRSKYTKDKKYGTDGWVDLLDNNQKKLAIIQAGYGFELKVVTNYSTDAFSKKVWNVSSNSASGTRVTALNTKANYGIEDIFVELPGNNSTRKILSSTGYEGTTLGLKASKKVSGDNVTWTYTVKPTDSLGIKETPKIFIPETTRDGDYTLKIYTPPVSGVGSINKKTYSALCDRKEVTIKVKGSAMDDLNSHHTQVR